MNTQEPVLTSLNLKFPVWEQIFTVHPLVVIGTVNSDSSPNFAPKHMVFPLGWENYFGFVCTPRHTTYQNIKNREEFTVTYPKPDQIVVTSMTASPRNDENKKTNLDTLQTFEASDIDGLFLQNGYAFLECKLMKIVDGFGENSLILAKIVAAQAWSDVIKNPSHTDDESIYNHPRIAYISPGRYAIIDETYAFPFPANFKK
ncbi:flavin reductase [Rhodohalobacter sp. SW132]|uniref:flavin reductase n=1 Tax=Rhodohalobacter sp. SW132 TaxID=2293433 RepID=UPI000E24FBD1|nr:flavin reductase [Rhodohalobacter sp. SW132]REL37722.1 flavin reductase [Rhodohalobacter sp. SW132]